MRELTAHIENLLLTNDCVIVPSFGGFVTYRLPAKWVEEQNSFLPPVRTVGFNPRLQLNDGLLVQSYMSFYGTSFPDAHKRVLRGVKALKEKLYSEGKIDFPSLGTLRLSLDGSFHFTPYIDGVNSPELYGLAELRILPLRMEEAETPEAAPTREEPAREIPFSPAEEEAPRHPRLRRLAGETLRWASATAAAVLLFLLFSTPVRNVLPEDSYKAQVVSSRFFSATRPEPGQEAPKARPASAAAPQEQKQKPAPVETTSTAYKKRLAPKAPAAKPRQPEAPASKYFIVVASLQKTESAEKFCRELKEKGHAHARIIPGKTTQKVCIDHTADADRALTLLREYRETYEDAWMLTQEPAK